MTEKAQSMARRMLGQQDPRKDGLRIAVIGGGCSGKSYKLGWDDVKESDHIHSYDGLVVMVDPKSAEQLQGASLEFHDGLEKSGFEVINPSAEATCGCGKSFC